MRIKCPSCAAVYEVDSALVPPEGRELQCSACGHVWFEGDVEATRSDLTGTKVQDDPEKPGQEPEAEDIDHHDEEPTASGGSTSATETGNAENELASEPSGAAARGLDPAVSSILRQEAEYEAQARARENARIETQPELGLMAQTQWPSQTRADDKSDADAPVDEHSDSDADLTSQEQEEDKKSAANDPFPDIEDLSSTLEPVTAKRQAAGKEIGLPPTEPARRSGFARGLMLVFVFAALLVVLYVTAPALASLVPGLEAPLSTYVDLVEQLWRTVHGLI